MKQKVHVPGLGFPECPQGVHRLSLSSLSVQSRARPCMNREHLAVFSQLNGAQPPGGEGHPSLAYSIEQLNWSRRGARTLARERMLLLQPFLPHAGFLHSKSHLSPTVLAGYTIVLCL